MIKNTTPPAFSLKQAVLMAEVLDSLGLHEDANLLDSYAKEISNKGIEKTAGIWSNVWEKLKGKAKRILFKKYKILYERALEVQEEVVKRMDIINSHYKTLSKNIKTYQLEEWANGINSFTAINGPELLREFNFQEAYSDYANLLYTGAGEGEDDEVPERKEEKIGEWYAHVNRREPRIQKHYKEENLIRIHSEIFSRWVRHLRGFLGSKVDENKNLFTINFKAKGTLPTMILEALGNDVWERVPAKGDADFVYLKRVAKRDLNEDPAIPLEGEDISKQEINPETVEEMFPDPEQPKKKPNIKVKKNVKPKEESKPEKKKEIKRWFKMIAGPYEGKFSYLSVDLFNPGFMAPVNDAETIKKLEEADKVKKEKHIDIEQRASLRRQKARKLIN